MMESILRLQEVWVLGISWVDYLAHYESDVKLGKAQQDLGHRWYGCILTVSVKSVVSTVLPYLLTCGSDFAAGRYVYICSSPLLYSLNPISFFFVPMLHWR